MILHIVAFDLIDSATEDDVAGLSGALEEMAAGLPQLRFYACGANLRLRDGGSDFGVVAILDNRQGLDGYLDGDAHKKVAADWLSWIVVGRHAVQLELDPAALVSTVASFSGQD
ncbi:MAG: Dabb family protein [Actinomycetota bacterium]|nr:Dabb family protein [Actinomycetota bacterium]